MARQLAFASRILRAAAAVLALGAAGCGDDGGMNNGGQDLTAGCVDDKACSGVTPRCDVKSGRCVPCLPANDNCPMGTYCVDIGGSFSCTPGCNDSAACKGDDGGGAMARACCDHLCIDTDSDPKNCGACGNACTNGKACCAGRCVDTAADVGNCGGCGKACPTDTADFTCEMSACVLKSCKVPFADCDKQAQNGCEVNTDTDPMNCLGCGMICSLPNGAGACNKGCAVGKCEPGFEDCNRQLGDGCEVNTTIDVANCGACGVACGAAANGSASCAAGKCAVSACNGTFLDCDMNFANGCEADGSSNVAHCGKCGNACPAVPNGMPGCAGGGCGVGSCNGAFRDCDGNAQNGCEVDGATDAKNCGACGKACPAVQNGVAGCTAGACGVAMCNAGFRDCNGNPLDGCEVDARTDVKNCGNCGTVCPGNANNSPVCANSACGLIPCAPPFRECDGIAGNGCEANTNTDVKNCGGCNIACPAVANAAPGCAAGVCGIGVCNAPFKNCDNMAANGCEVNSNTDVNNCGTCGTKCSAPNGVASCAMGTCGIGMCNLGFRNCDNMVANGCEVNSNTDVSNCGTCGTKCVVANGTPGCMGGVCTIASCAGAFKDCKNGPADGCETNTASDVANCGGCGKACGAVANGTPGCAASVCGVGSCNAPFANCDGNAGNGCETNKNTDPKNCGACGNICPNGLCTNGTCKEAVLVVGAPGNVAWNNDVKAKLDGTAAFRLVDVFDARGATPSLQTLKNYQAVLVYSDSQFGDPVALGNTLADYFDGGGRVVVATFANALSPLKGRWQVGLYDLINPVGQASPNEAAALQIVEANSPLLSGVKTLTATSAFRGTGAAINGGIIVARWGSGTPLVVRGNKGGRAYVSLNFYPPSSAVRADFWNGDGAALMANALLFRGFCHSIVGKNGGVCPSGKIEFCDPQNPIVATTAAQAGAACQACYGANCFVETGDCAGAGFGPKPNGMAVPGDAYFGYVAGCSGVAGRIWSFSSSYTTYGRWAP